MMTSTPLGYAIKNALTQKNSKAAHCGTALQGPLG